MIRPALASALCAALLAGCGQRQPPGVATAAGGDPHQGARIIAAAGCGGCHEIPGVHGARGLVGPPLTGMGGRTTVAGVLPNTPEALARWVQAPQAVLPGNAMPDMGLSAAQARDVAAYLESLG